MKYTPGTHFDLYVKYRHLIPEALRQYVRKARLFSFDIYPTESFDGLETERVDELADTFCLPFPVVALEDRSSCVIVYDLELGTLGLEHPRGVLDISKVKSYDERSYNTGDTADWDAIRASLQGAGAYGMYRSGIVDIWWDKRLSKWRARSPRNVTTLFFSERGDLVDLYGGSGTPPELEEASAYDLNRAAIVGYEELVRMSALQLFVLERRSPDKPVKAKKKNRLRYKRAHERPLYTVVRAREARRIMGLAEPERALDEKGREILERRAHIRQGHARTLRSPKFKHKQGQTVRVKRSYIPAVWRGPSEAHRDNHYYRVILDLPKAVRDRVEGD